MKFMPVRVAEELVTVEQSSGKNIEMLTTNDEDKFVSAKVADAENVLPLEIHELLDRFEILYPHLDDIADLRRAYVDKDLSSIFKLLSNEVSGDINDLRKAVLEENMHSIFRIVDNTRAIGELEDLRKAVIDQNLHSLFRLLPGNEELRKAVIEKNLHSIFRLAEDEDLRKLILEDNTWKLWPILDRYVDTQFVDAFKSFFVNNTKIDKDCFSRGQLKSKLWLVNELRKLKVNDLGTVFLCAGWYATLATMIFESGIKVNKIRSFDIDPGCVDIAETFNKPWFTDQWRFKSITQNIMYIDYNEHTWQYWSNANNRMSYPIIDNPDTIINTSCEHLVDFIGWYSKIPIGKLVVIQANDFHEVDEHVNTYNTIEEFIASAPMTTVLFAGELELEKYKRFMLIGYR